MQGNNTEIISADIPIEIPTSSEEPEDDYGILPEPSPLPEMGLVHRYVVAAQMDFIARLYAACTTMDPALLRRVYSSLPWPSQACLDMHGAL
ncbi:hypothetical protein TNCV_3182541 [Trichonephila clavipes]|uniref:Uncharacterized protein n=1 Tax=Trichonephila clavipes TaxID=2585209 RepID=A0A8X6SLT0_TRICX|nr:hypothetical protein TNCV_3182541 [Trichonephila clavipes]